MKKLSLKRLIMEVEDAPTMPPPAPAAQSNRMSRPSAQQQMMKRREQMKQHRSQLNQAQNLADTIKDVTDSIRMSLGSSKTLQASQDLAQLQSVVQKLQQMISQLPQLESKLYLNKNLTEDHNNKEEKFVQKILNGANQKLFNASVAIKGGNYQEALNQMSLVGQQLKKGMEVLQKHIQNVEGDDDVFFPVD